MVCEAVIAVQGKVPTSTVTTVASLPKFDPVSASSSLGERPLSAQKRVRCQISVMSKRKSPGEGRDVRRIVGESWSARARHRRAGNRGARHNHCVARTMSLNRADSELAFQVDPRSAGRVQTMVVWLIAVTGQFQLRTVTVVIWLLGGPKFLPRMTRGLLPAVGPLAGLSELTIGASKTRLNTLLVWYVLLVVPACRTRL